MKLLLIMLLGLNLAQAQDPKLPQEKELDVVDFQNVKDVLKKDGLDLEVQKKKNEVVRIQEIRTSEEKKRYLWPSEAEFWPLAAEYWLVKNAPLLSWDFDHPEYGLSDSLATIMKTLGMLQKRFRILALNSNAPGHLSIPWSEGEYCLLFSVPFMRSMDLSKLEISLLLLEDILRANEGWLKDYARPKKLGELVGNNFQGTKPDISPLVDVSKAYTTFIAEKGFTFQQQFQITKKMDGLLKPHPELWNAYVRLLGKIDRLVKGNPAFADYVKLYPSPEMQIRWLAPEEKVP